MTETNSPQNVGGLKAGISVANQQPSGFVGQICTTCPDNWVSAGAKDETTGEPIPGLGYRIYETTSGDMVASGILDKEGESPQHRVPDDMTEFYVVYGTEEAMDEAKEKMEETQRQQALEANALPDWNGIPAGLDETDFNAEFDQLPSNADISHTISPRREMMMSSRDVHLEKRAHSFDDYQLATGARAATRTESVVGGAGQGVSFGFGDEALARLDSMFSEKSYAEAVAARRQTIEAQRISNPGHFMAGEVIGAVPTIFIPVGGAAASAARAGQGIRGATTAGAKTGAVTGGISGAGHAEGGVIQRLDGAARGAVTGGVGGAVLSGAGVLIARGVSRTRIWGKISGNKSISKRLDDLYRRAPQTKSEIDDMATEIADQYGGRVATAPLKGRERALEKVVNDYGGDTSKLSDVARNTIVVDRSQMQNVIRDLEARGATVKVVDAASDPFGYSGALSKVRTSNGMLGEIQVNTPEMIFAKEPSSIARSIIGKDSYNSMISRYGDIGGKGHVFYEQGRSVGVSAAELQRLNDQSRAYYEIFQ